MIFKILEPDWYMHQSSGAANVLTNLVYLLPALIANTKGHPSLSKSLVALVAGSGLYHINPTRHTLLIDRVCMMVVMTLTYRYLYPHITFTTYIALGLAALMRWWITKDISWWISFQLLGAVLLTQFAIQFGILSELLPWFTIGLAGSFIQLINSPITHPIKHILTGVSLAGIYNTVL